MTKIPSTDPLEASSMPIPNLPQTSTSIGSMPIPNLPQTSTPARQPKAASSGILVELGLSKSQIKQLPKSITDEADFIDGVRNIVASMPDGVQKDIMLQSIVEAIEIFKNNLLQQEDVELTNEQIEDIKKHESEEEKKIRERGDEEPPKTDEGDEEPPKTDEGDEEPPKTDEGDEEPTKKDEEPRRGGIDDEEPQPSKKREDDEHKEKGGEDLPKTPSGGGGGGGGGTPIDIPEEAYPIAELNEEQKKYIYYNVIKNPNYTPITPNRKATLWNKEQNMFFGLDIEDMLAAWILLVKNDIETNRDFLDLSKPNLFSLIKYLWEFHKGYEALVLDRYYIYSQYSSFLMFLAAGLPHHSSKYAGLGIYPYDVLEEAQIRPTALSSAKRIPNYYPILDNNGYFAGIINAEDYKYFESWLQFELDKDKTGDDRLIALLSNKYDKIYGYKKTKNAYYINNSEGFETIIQDNVSPRDYYVEAYKRKLYGSLKPMSTTSFREFYLEGSNIKLGSKKAYSNIVQQGFDVENAAHYTLDTYETITLLKILYKFYYANDWVDFQYMFLLNTPKGGYKIKASYIFPLIYQFVRMSGYDNFTASIDGTNNLYFNHEGSEFNLSNTKEFKAFGLHQIYSFGYENTLFPFPYIDNSLNWKQKIAIKFEPTKEPPVKKARKKKEYTSEQQEIVDEINALKQALKYVSGDEAESIKQEIEALKQSLKYV